MVYSGPDKFFDEHILLTRLRHDGVKTVSHPRILNQLMLVITTRLKHSDYVWNLAFQYVFQQA